ncbi:amidohydrolase family protein [Paracoccus sp. PAR01]|nr:amidohydrolase family protein [Paracoccus sp. PAR01]
MHANGEGASDMLIAAVYATTKKYGPADHRPVIIHGQFLCEAAGYLRFALSGTQLLLGGMAPRPYRRAGVCREHLADGLAGQTWDVSSHHDATMAMPNSTRFLDATVTRRSRAGDIIVPAQRVDVTTALKSTTIWPVWRHSEAASKGSIETSKLADFVVLSDIPTTIASGTIDTIKVQTMRWSTRRGQSNDCSELQYRNRGRGCSMRWRGYCCGRGRGR